jgi:WD40 repeat protein
MSGKSASDFLQTTVKILELASTKVAAEFPLLDGGPEHVTLSPDGATAFAAGGSNPVLAWDLTKRGPRPPRGPLAVPLTPSHRHVRHPDARRVTASRLLLMR